MSDPKHHPTQGVSSSNLKHGLRCSLLTLNLAACLKPTNCLRHRSIEIECFKLVFEPKARHTVWCQTQSPVCDTKSKEWSVYPNVSSLLLNDPTCLGRANTLQRSYMSSVSARSETCINNRRPYTKFDSKPLSRLSFSGALPYFSPPRVSRACADLYAFEQYRCTLQRAAVPRKYSSLKGSALQGI